MTNWIIGHTDRFKAAVSLFGIFHLQTDYSNSNFSRWDNDYLGAYYWEDPDIYRRLSPGTYLDAIHTPTLIVHGDEDDNTFISNSKEMYQALRHRGVVTGFVHYPREGHGLAEPNHRLDEVRRCLAWMDRYLKPQAPARVGDTVKQGNRELCVTRAERAAFAGEPSQGEKDPPRLLEVAFTLHSLQPESEAFHLPLQDVRLEVTGGPALTPVGVPMETHGMRLLVEGEGLRLTQHPDPQTGLIAFACCVVFRVPPSAGEGDLKTADFPPFRFSWSSEEEEE